MRAFIVLKGIFGLFLTSSVAFTSLPSSFFTPPFGIPFPSHKHFFLLYAHASQCRFLSGRTHDAFLSFLHASHYKTESISKNQRKRYIITHHGSFWWSPTTWRHILLNIRFLYQTTLSTRHLLRLPFSLILFLLLLLFSFRSRLRLLHLFLT